MSISDKLNADIKSSMLAKNKLRLAALRAIKSAFLIESSKGVSNEISDDIAQNIVVKLHKQRIEASKIYLEQNREDLANEETDQAKVLEDYLPKRLSESEVEAVLQSIIDKVGATNPSDMGKVMGPAMGQLKGKADGQFISSMVKKLLN
ncbi:MAG: GatB/YqeY domain-containing protein [Flavobacteriales bacterium]|nr:GatB/YqeY domain-containing protein [Flavobacteriales bacterium]